MDLEGHNLQIAEENGNLRVLTAGRSYLMKRIGREDLLKQYREAWARARLNFTPLVTDTETLEFTPPEQLSLKQRVVLYWLYVYNVNNRRFRLLWWSLGDSQVRRDVLRAAEVKYGDKSEKAIGLAAHTLKMSAKKFGSWMERDEELMNMR